MTIATVVNVRMVNGERPEFDVYIGRANGRAGFKKSKWANPFPVKQFGGNHRLAVEAYRDWIETQHDLLAAIPELVGKRLGCWCAPEPCHGDVLARYANAYAAGNWTPPMSDFNVGDTVRLTRDIYEPRRWRGRLYETCVADAGAIGEVVAVIMVGGAVGEYRVEFGDVQLCVPPEDVEPAGEPGA